jgi:hypothetical protein
MSMFCHFDEDYTDPGDYIDTIRTKNQFGQTVHEVPKTMEQEFEEFKHFFNKCSHEGQTVIIQRIVKSYPDEVKEFLKEV